LLGYDAGFFGKEASSFLLFLSIIFTYYVMHEKKIVVIYQEKMLFFLEFLGSLKKVPKRLSFLKTSKMGVVEVEFHRSQIMIEIKKENHF